MKYRTAFEPGSYGGNGGKDGGMTRKAMAIMASRHGICEEQYG